jgi:hypothetical protein
LAQANSPAGRVKEGRAGWAFEVSAAVVVTAAGGKPFYDFREALAVEV